MCSGIGLVGNCGVWIIVVGGLVVGLVVLVGSSSGGWRNFCSSRSLD